MTAALEPEQDVPSPCIAVCEILPGLGVCAGCFRTLDEIAVWSVLDAADKRAVLAELPGRRAALGIAGRRSTRGADA